MTLMMKDGRSENSIPNDDDDDDDAAYCCFDEILA